MAYNAYERTAGTSCLNEVQALERHLTDNGAFTSNTVPTLSQVEEFITDTYHEIGNVLITYGYAKTQDDTDVLGTLQHYNALGTCAKIELTQPSVGYRTGENTRYDRFFKEFDKVRGLIESIGFQRLGATRVYELSEYMTAGGISISDKETIETDSDFEKYIFEKDLMKHPGTIAKEEEEE